MITDQGRNGNGFEIYYRGADGHAHKGYNGVRPLSNLGLAGVYIKRLVGSLPLLNRIGFNQYLLS